MYTRTQQLINLAKDDGSSRSKGEIELSKIITELRNLDRTEIKKRFSKEEIKDLVSYIIFEEQIC